MHRELRENLIDELLPKFGSDLTETDEWLTNLIAESRCVMWDMDDYRGLKTWTEDADEIGFSVVLHFGGDQDGDYYSPFNAIEARIEGVAVNDNGTWKIDSYEMHRAEYDVDPEDFESSYKEAVLSNEDYYGTFSQEIERLRQLANIELENVDIRTTLYRQIYVGIVTCLETFLSDAFIHNVISDADNLESFFKNFKFPEEKLYKRELYEIAISGRIDDIAKNEMVEIIYHNLTKVKAMYEQILKVNFPIDEELLRAVDIRHDLVHRNGRTKKNEDVIVDRDMIRNLMIRVEGFVTKLNESLEANRNRWIAPANLKGVPF